MKVVLTFLIFLLSCHLLSAQYVSKLIEYLPAPGQVINTESAGSIEAAVSLTSSGGGLVSLGSFGGYVVYGFDSPVENDPGNPYGVDFVIFGNAQPDWSEPGIVMVMKDENQNGLADDKWFELAGSDYFFSDTKKGFKVTYSNPGGNSAEDVYWVSNDLSSGLIFANNYHLQSYFPSDGLLSGVPNDNISFEGTRINEYIDISNPGMVKNYERRFGYADNHIKINSDYKLPDNPYTETFEGCGGDPMDISWAVDSEGNYVNIDRIDFVKVYTGVLANAGWLGEISTEISAIVDVPSAPSIKGSENCVVIKDLPLKVIVGDTVDLEAFAFKKGRYDKNEEILWQTDRADILTFTSDKKIVANNSGVAIIKACFSGNKEIFATRSIEIVKPANLQIEIESQYLRVGDQIKISGFVYDESNKKISNIKTQWKVSDADVIEIVEKNGMAYLTGISEGESELTFSIEAYGNLSAKLSITVLSASENKEVYVTVKDENSTIFPRKTVTAGSFNLTPFVDRATDDYGVKSVSTVTLAHAIAKTFIDEGYSSYFRFRDDEMGNNSLYLWKVPKGDESNMEFVYGYGGYTASAAFSKSWIVILNNKQIVTDLNNYHLKNGDEIIVYHQSDISEEWNVSSFYSDKSEVALMEDIEVSSILLSCKVNSEGRVEVTGTEPVSDCQIWVNDELAYVNGNKVLTDDNGKAQLNFREKGLKYISNGLDQLIINVGGTTSVEENIDGNAFKMWPQPASGNINITSKDKILSIKIFDITGRLAYLADDVSALKLNLDISSLRRGSYILQAKTVDGIVNKKLIIQ